MPTLVGVQRRDLPLWSGDLGVRGPLEQTCDQSRPDASYNWLGFSLEHPKTNSGRCPMQGPSSMVRGPLECRVCLSRLVIGPARTPPMVGLGFP
ncbi:hypothetical protein TIFTF001_017484 [Ficus carica]|uniref:Uncharacterized protein n=1 Tax=Ficus carica TaxID=3494 RepID=A0AA88AL95_FICCA|nr:hypothetical protein TIFTF001_017484 [Ficus carica]